MIGWPAVLRACVSLKLNFVPPIPKIFPFLGVSRNLALHRRTLGEDSDVIQFEILCHCESNWPPLFGIRRDIRGENYAERALRREAARSLSAEAATTGAGAGAGGNDTAGFAAIGTGVGVGTTTGAGAVLVAVATGAPCFYPAWRFAAHWGCGAALRAPASGVRICSIISGRNAGLRQTNHFRRR